MTLMKFLCIRCKQEFGGWALRSKRNKGSGRTGEKIARSHHAKL